MKAICVRAGPIPAWEAIMRMLEAVSSTMLAIAAQALVVGAIVAL